MEGVHDLPFDPIEDFEPIGLITPVPMTIVARADLEPETLEDRPQPLAWRGMVLILGTIVFFGATVRGLGFIPVVFLSAVLTAFSSRENSPLAAVTIAVALTVLCLVIFVLGLGLIVPWFGPWLSF